MKMLQELSESIRLCESLGMYGRAHVLTEVSHGSERYSLPAVEVGSKDPDAPVLGIVGGIHGLEKIGTWVCHAFMGHLKSRLDWDQSLAFMLSRMRLFFIPLVNPVGMKNSTRSNGQGVDLMRNAPVHSEEASFGVGGHHLSKKLPWFRGNVSFKEDGMEPELQAVYRFIKAQTEHSAVSVILDLHSGFGVVDQIWFPYAKETAPPHFIAEIYSLKRLFESTNPNHIYRFEPQSKHYCTHGDLWDYLVLEKNKSSKNNQIFLPFTLEMGSWNWIKKNPVQLFSFLGPFNPVKPHRIKRALRRHLPLFDFLLQAMSSPDSWSKVNEATRTANHEAALKEWYKK